MTKQEKYAEKIAALLAKAESTTPEEAELLVEKAQQLMTEYAISEAMLDAARGVERDEIGQEKVTMVGVFRDAQGELLWAIARNNNCRAVQLNNTWRTVEVGGKKYKNSLEYTLTGFRSDLDRVSLLFSSLQIQAATAQQQWAKNGGIPDWYGSSDKWRARRDFIAGFASAIAARLETANRAAREAAAKDEAVRTETSVTEATESVALVLRSRKDRVDEWYDQKYGKSLRSARASYRRSDFSARAAGSSAGQRADLGQTRIAGRKGISR